MYQVLAALLDRNIIKLDGNYISQIIFFDEVHNVRDDHIISRILERFYPFKADSPRPNLLGFILGGRIPQDPIALEALMCSELWGVSEPERYRHMKRIAKPEDLVVLYAPEQPKAPDSQLFKAIQMWDPEELHIGHQLETARQMYVRTPFIRDIR